MKLLRKLRHLLWPFARHEPPPEQVEHLRFLKDARRYGVEQQRASYRAQRELRHIRDSRDFSDVMAAPPPWRHEGGGQ